MAEPAQAAGLDIGKADLAAELARKLAIDRSVPGFEDFSLAGTRGIEPGFPAASLLYHAFASPDVHPSATGNPATSNRASIGQAVREARQARYRRRRGT